MEYLFVILIIAAITCWKGEKTFKELITDYRHFQEERRKRAREGDSGKK